MRNSFEGAALESVDLDRIHDKAERALEAARVHETDAADIARADDLDAKFEKGATRESGEMKKVADIFEAVVLEHGELSNWFGDNATTAKTSRYDDYVNGIDLLVEFPGLEGGTEHLGLAMDVTFTNDTTSKFDRLKEKIGDGDLIEVKYHSADLGEGPIGVPEVIIGAEKRTVLEVGELWIERQNKELSRHRIQIQILRQIEAGLETLGMYARSVRQESIAVAYERRLGTIRELLAEKADIEREARFTLMDDSVHSSIMSFLASWKKSLLTAKAA
ncbi:MAG: hypothetical protein JWN50_125 [Parcubacteria group bacterium]|nr:hypothetical protein [Parcubacteria group bacterium]